LSQEHRYKQDHRTWYLYPSLAGAVLAISAGFLFALTKYSMLRVLSSTFAPVVTRTEVKQYLRINIPDDDALIDDLLFMAHEALEHDANLCLNTYTIAETFKEFPGQHGVYSYPWLGYNWQYMGVSTHSTIVLMRRPLQSVTSITYFDTQNSPQTVSPTAYIVEKPTYTHGWVAPLISEFPLTTTREDAVTITYVAGYTTGNVPFRIQQAIKVLCWGEYHHEDVTEQYQRLMLPLQTSRYPG
jgi:uncharacterized phiE125 gp8 family phage protein